LKKTKAPAGTTDKGRIGLSREVGKPTSWSSTELRRTTQGQLMLRNGRRE